MTDPQSRRRITELDAMVGLLSEPERARFERIFHLSTAWGRVVPPEGMVPWLRDHFGSAEAVRRQRIVKLTNRITLEGTLFNELRASRPIEAPSSGDDRFEEVIRSSEGGPFCQPMEGTPEDMFGRVRGQTCITASNVAKFDGWHSVIISDEHHPLRFDAAHVADYVDTAQEWARRVHAMDPEACYPLFIWNCLWRSGASILHGHAQMAVTRGMHYAKVESGRRAAERYQEDYGASYFADLIATHRSVGLALDLGEAAILPSLTPFKEMETHIIAPAVSGDLKAALNHVLDRFVSRLGVQSFNLALYLPPLGDTTEKWAGYPVIARLLDRGDLSSKTSDVGAMEIFAQSVVSSDPFRVADALSGSLPLANKSR
ncbi:hypothetical protein ACFLT5_01115 [Chloroflexota bacterium]